MHARVVWLCGFFAQDEDMCLSSKDLSQPSQLKTRAVCLYVGISRVENPRANLIDLSYHLPTMTPTNIESVLGASSSTLPCLIYLFYSIRKAERTEG